MPSSPAGPTREAAGPARLPVTVLTGFLGAGKTTLLDRLVRSPALARAAVVINEFGETGLDHLLVESSAENTVLLNSGCLCCTVRGDLVDTMRDLFLKRVRGLVPDFDRVVIETTGLADPAPILHTLMSDPLIGARFRLDGVVTLVDAVHGEGQLDRHPESVKQAAVADRIVLSKTDLAPEAAVESLERRLRALNPAAPILRAVRGEIDPDLLLNAGLYDPATKTLDVRRWLAAEAYAAQGHGHGGHSGHDHDHDHDHDSDNGHDDGHGHAGHDVNRHDAHIRAFCLSYDEPFSWDAFAGWIDALVALRGDDVLRIKGILRLRETDKPVVVHGVQHIFHPPVQLEAWPDADRRSRIVFITRDLGEDTIEALRRAHVAGPGHEKDGGP